MCEEQLDCLLLAAGASRALLDGLDQRDVVALKMFGSIYVQHERMANLEQNAAQLVAIQRLHVDLLGLVNDNVHVLVEPCGF